MKLTRVTDNRHKRKLMGKGGMLFSRVCPVTEGLTLYLTDGEETPHYYVVELDKDETAKIPGTLNSGFLYHEQRQPKVDVSWIDRLLGRK